MAAAVIAVLGALVGPGPAEIATHSMTARQVQWDVGPAPIEGVFEDIEDPEGWQMRFWRKLTTVRDAPNRG